MKQYKFTDKFLNLSDDEIEDDVELFYIDLVEELGIDEVSNMFDDEINMLYFTRHLESKEDSSGKKLN
jgi:hypothetical protein